MIDYRTHLAALALQTAHLAARPIADPVLAAQRDHQVGAVQTASRTAQLGALVDHLLRHAGNDGAELALLERAAALWADGLRLYAAVERIRDDVQGALADPADPGAAAAFCAATRTLRGLAEEFHDKHADIATLTSDVRAMDHLPEHPRQADLRTDRWPWGDLFLARRTDAFARTMFAHANSPDELAFAFGVLSSSTANACGSAFHGQVVGGPRRAHRFRDRVASTTLGSWFAQSRPELRRCADIADRIRFGAGPEPELPQHLADLLQTVLDEVYDPALRPPGPDLHLGYRRLVRHLELLDRFEQPPAPTPLPLTLIAEIYGDPANPPAPITTPTTSTPPVGHGPGITPTTYSGYPTGGNPGQPTQTDNTVDAGEACGAFWLGVLAFLGFAVLLGGPCWEQWGSGKRCTYWDKYVAKNFETAFSPPALSQEERDELASQQQPLSAGQLGNAVVLRQLTELAAQLFEFQKGLWEALGKAKAYLTGSGLLYPDGKLGFPLYRQFLTVPEAAGWPHRPEPDPVRRFYRYPPTPLEYPVAQPNLLPAGAGPARLRVLLGAAATETWIDMISGVRGTANPDLDADRGVRHDCWATGGSINDNPVDVQLLGYQEM
ncbi:hypothetical protein [Nocardia sp. NPDC057668]|uniref:hypothetical protein n=1 Tax=Nocardia sp. NPDC057668 TaxID=3346202 RepID=UPI00366A8D0C